jgi:transcriptional regulator with XRE-family HTH domain
MTRSTTAAQLRAARHLAGLSQADVAKATGLSMPTIKRAESEREVSVSPDAIDAICAALETAGVEFTSGAQPGVRMGAAIARINAEIDTVVQRTVELRAIFERVCKAGGAAAIAIAATHIDEHISVSNLPSDSLAQIGKNTLTEKRRGYESLRRRARALIAAGFDPNNELKNQLAFP